MASAKKRGTDEGSSTKQTMRRRSISFNPRATELIIPLDRDEVQAEETKANLQLQLQLDRAKLAQQAILQGRSERRSSILNFLGFGKRRRASAQSEDATGGEVVIKCMWENIEARCVHTVPMPAPRSGQASFTLGNKDPRIYIHGGVGVSGVCDDLYVFHTEMKKWSRCHLWNSPRGRSYHSVSLIGPDPYDSSSNVVIPRLLLIGGFYEGGVDDDIKILPRWSVLRQGKGSHKRMLPPLKVSKDARPPPDQEFKGDMWMGFESYGEVPLGRCNHTFTNLGTGYGYLLFGWHGAFLNQVYKCSTKTGAWKLMTPKFETANILQALPPRAGHTATLVHNRYIVVFGGQTSRNEYLNDVIVLDTEVDVWFSPKITGNAPTRRSGHSACFDAEGERLIFYGGWSGLSNRQDVFILKTVGNPHAHWEWVSTAVVSSGPGPRVGHSAEFIGKKMYVFGGFVDGIAMNDVHALDFRSIVRFKTAVRAVTHERRKSLFAQVVDEAVGKDLVSKAVQNMAESENFMQFIDKAEQNDLEDIDDAIQQAMELRIQNVKEKVKGNKEALEDQDNKINMFKERLLLRAKRRSLLDEAVQGVQSLSMTTSTVGRDSEEFIELDAASNVEPTTGELMLPPDPPPAEETVDAIAAGDTAYTIRDGTQSKRDLLDLIATTGGLNPAAPKVKQPSLDPSKDARPAGKHLEEALKNENERYMAMKRVFKVNVDDKSNKLRPVPKHPTRPARRKYAHDFAKELSVNSLLDHAATQSGKGGVSSADDELALTTPYQLPIDLRIEPRYVVEGDGQLPPAIHEAVRKIQAGARAYLARRQMVAERAALRIQAVWRGRSQRRQIREEKGKR